jgi:hypothetical protein
VPLVHSLSFRVLTFSSRCALQEVSTPRSLAFFPVLTCSFQYALQNVSAPRSLARFPSVSLPVPLMRFLESECTSARYPLSVFSLVTRDALSSP